MTIATIILILSAAFIPGVFTGWCLRTYWFVKDRDCADPDHCNNTFINDHERIP